MSFTIENRSVGPDHPCFIIAEVAQAHDGSLGAAHAYIEVAARAGVDAVKFQTHLAAAESTLREPWRVRFSRQDATRYDYWRRMEFTPDQWAGLRDHAREKGLIFLSSPFSPQAVDLLDELGMPAWKVASGELSNLPLLRHMARLRKPMLLSSGMSSYAELDVAAQVCRESGVPMALFQCTTAYPCPPEMVGLEQLPRLAERHHCPVGLSDHSGTIFAGLAAVTVGASLLEVHVTFSRECFGPDVPASLVPEELATLVQGARFIERMRNSRVDKDRMAAEAAPMRRVFGKSIVAAMDLPAGTVLEEAALALKKPGDGLPPSRLPEVLGRRLRRAVRRDEPLEESALE